MPTTSRKRCKQKVGYASQDEAFKAEWIQRGRYGKRSRYRCNSCSMWHLTSKRTAGSGRGV